MSCVLSLAFLGF